MYFLQPSGKSILAILIVFSLFLPACASRGGKTYSDSEVRQVQTVVYGTVADVNQVDVADDPNGVGAVAGGVAGGVLGSLLGGGTGRVFGALGGAALGALGGTAIEKTARTYKAAEITVDLDKKAGTIIVVQGNDEVFKKGDKVRVLTSSAGKVRVQHRN